MVNSETRPESSEKVTAAQQPTSLVGTILQIAKEAGPASILAVLWVILPATAGFWLLYALSPVSSFLESLGPSGFILFMLVFMLTSGIGLLPTYAQAVLAGWIWGITWGSLGSIAGFTGGAIIGYGISRLVARQRIDKLIERYPKARVIRKALIGRGNWRTFGLVTLLRIPPNAPFAVSNLVMSSCGVRLVPYVCGTILGMLPRSVVFVTFAALASQATTNSTGEKVRDIQDFIKGGPGLSVLLVGGAVLIISLLIITRISQRALEHVVEQGEPKA